MRKYVCTHTRNLQWHIYIPYLSMCSHKTCLPYKLTDNTIKNVIMLWLHSNNVLQSTIQLQYCSWVSYCNVFCNLTVPLKLQFNDKLCFQQTLKAYCWSTYPDSLSIQAAADWDHVRSVKIQVSNIMKYNIRCHHALIIFRLCND